jgi:hypothetical protein
MLVKTIRALTVAELIQAGCLQTGDMDMPQKLASFMQRNRSSVQRRFIRPGVVTGNIASINSPTSSSISLAWDVTRTAGLPVGAPGRFVGPLNSDPKRIRSPVSYTFVSGAPALPTDINQIAQVNQAVAATATVNFAMDVIANNVIGDASATFTKIKELWIELLTNAQGATELSGAEASDVTMGNHATNAWAGVLGATSTYNVKLGGMWHHQDQSIAGTAVTAGDFLKTVNNDSTKNATLRITLFGLK